MSAHVFVRHPPLPDMGGLCYGHLDPALDPAVFASAATPLADALPGWPIATSPSTRCLHLARALQEEVARRGTRAPRLTIDARLRELDFGEWEGMRWEALPRDALDAWSRDLAGFAPPRGESFRHLVARVDAALAALDEPHIVVTHAGVVRAAWRIAGCAWEQAAGIQVPHLEPIRIDATPVG